MKQVSLVIPTWNAAADVARALEALVPLEQPGEILVVDNGVVNQETADVVAKFQQKYPEVRYLGFAKQLGYAGAVNEGVLASRYRYVAVMNNDNVASRGWLTHLIQEMEATPSCAIATANVKREGIANKKGGLSLFGRIVYSDEDCADSPYQVFQPDGSAFLLDKEKVPLPYEAEYFIYHEDSALGWKAHIMDYSVRFVPKAHVSTFDGGSTRRIPYKTAFYTERNRWLNYLVFPERNTILKCLPLWLLDSLAAALIRKNLRARVHSWVWLVTHPIFILRLRQKMQKLRTTKDKEILPLLYGSYHPRLDSILFAYFRLVGLHLRR